MRRKGVVFSKMFVLRSMGNELVPSPQLSMENSFLTWGLFHKNCSYDESCDNRKISRTRIARFSHDRYIKTLCDRQYDSRRIFIVRWIVDVMYIGFDKCVLGFVNTNMLRFVIQRNHVKEKLELGLRWG